VLYVDNGNVLTSAGAAAGFDLCLHLVRRDLGAEMAAEVARAAVMPLERATGESIKSGRAMAWRPTSTFDPSVANRGHLLRILNAVSTTKVAASLDGVLPM